jgi:hypothetical protein
MVSNTIKRHRWRMFFGAATAVALGLGAAQPAMAYGWHGVGWHGGGGWGARWRGAWWGPRVGIGFGYYGAPYVYAPAPVYYAPPVYYYPPLTSYYRQPAALAPPVSPPAVHKNVTHNIHHVAKAPCSCPAAPSPQAAPPAPAQPQ